MLEDVIVKYSIIDMCTGIPSCGSVIDLVLELCAAEKTTDWFMMPTK